MFVVSAPVFADELRNQVVPLQAHGGSVLKPLQSQSTEIGSDFSTPEDFNREIYYKNKLEFSAEGAVLPFNTPLLLGPVLGYNFDRGRKGWTPYYTLMPAILSLRWQLYDPMGPGFLRGNTDFSFGGVCAAITEGPESIFAGPLIGLRYNFVQPNWRLVPYVELRGGLGYTDAKGPGEVAHHKPDIGQGQDFTFTFMLGTGVRYNFSPRYSASLGLAYMHISNCYLSEPEYLNHGVNVAGPIAGFNIGLNDLFRSSIE
jgi:hypothetical protein